MNDVVTPPERGFPFQVVAEDPLGYKWAKWVTGIEVSDNTSFTGYWESRGADNTPTGPGLELALRVSRPGCRTRSTPCCSRA